MPLSCFFMKEVFYEYLKVFLFLKDKSGCPNNYPWKLFLNVRQSLTVNMHSSLAETTFPFPDYFVSFSSDSQHTSLAASEKPVRPKILKITSPAKLQDLFSIQERCTDMYINMLFQKVVGRISGRVKINLLIKEVVGRSLRRKSFVFFHLSWDTRDNGTMPSSISNSALSLLWELHT